MYPSEGECKVEDFLRETELESRGFVAHLKKKCFRDDLIYDQHGITQVTPGPLKVAVLVS
jgi:hypothetical protein